MAVICPECRSDNTEDSRFCKTCGGSIHPSETPSSGTQTLVAPEKTDGGEKLVAGRYLILSSLGHGGMGDVFKVRDTRLHEDMALKQLRPEIASDPDIIQRFRNELKLARKITHRNVCRVFDFHEEEGTPFITMEYVEGEDLKSRIRKEGTFGEAEALSIAVQIAEGLAEAHELGVIHRDLKPQNVMIEPSGRAKIMDFGIARSVDASGLTQTGQMIGTPDYLSSEQAAGRPADHRADIYALGVILYEMTTGSLPFKGDTALSVITKHREDTARDPREINPEISEGLSRLILRCMEKDPERRYQSVRDLLTDLRRLSGGEELPKVRGRRTGGRAAVGRKIGIAAAVGLVVVAAVVVFRQIQDRGPAPVLKEDRPSLAVLYFENNTGDESLEYWRKGFSELLTADLSQSKYINVLQGDKVYKILADLDQLEAQAYSSDVLRQVAQKGKVRHLIRGSYIKAGPRFRVSISLQDMESGEVVGTQTAEAESEENLFALVDELTPRIKSDLDLTMEQIAGDFDKEVAEATTSSPEAYELFIEGVRHHYRAEYELCIEFMDKALAIDPEFATAWGWKAFSYDTFGYHAEFVEAMTKAFELRHKASERERFRFTAYYYLRAVNDLPKAYEELQRFLAFYPEDIQANHQMGFLHFHAFEDYEKSKAYFNRAIELGSEIFYTYYLLAWVEMCQGHYDKAQEVAELFINEKGDHPEMRFSLAVNFLCRGQYEPALVEAEKAVEMGFAGTHWDYLFRGGILQAKGDLEEAERVYQNLVESRNALFGVTGHEALCQLALLQGRYVKARTHIEQAVDLAEAAGDEASLSRLYVHLAYVDIQKGAYESAREAGAKALEHSEKSMDPYSARKLGLLFRGLGQLALDDIEAAHKSREELRELSEMNPDQRQSWRDFLQLAGSIALKSGDTDSAVKDFEEAVSVLPAQNQDDLVGFKDSLRRTLYLASLAEAYFERGDMDSARSSYEKLASLTIGNHFWGDLSINALYWLGRISELDKKPKEAAAHYRKFLELWKDADPDIPELSDARARLSSQ